MHSDCPPCSSIPSADGWVRSAAMVARQAHLTTALQQLYVCYELYFAETFCKKRSCRVKFTLPKHGRLLDRSKTDGVIALQSWWLLHWWSDGVILPLNEKMQVLIQVSLQGHCFALKQETVKVVINLNKLNKKQKSTYEILSMLLF